MAEKRSYESREQRKRYIKRKRELCIALGVCRECMCRDALPGIKMCKECAEKSNKRLKDTREWYKSHGICVECREETAMQGKTICVNCSRADTLSYSHKYTPRYKPVKMTKPKMWQEQGFCYQCGAPTLSGRKQCSKHYEISRKRADILNSDKSNHIWRRLSDADVAKMIHK